MNNTWKGVAYRICCGGRPKYDILLNNICEVFNRQLLDARDAPIISALVYIREYLMQRIVIVQKLQMKCNGPLTPTVTKLFEVIKTAANQYTATWNGGDLYEVKGSWMDQCVIDMGQRICSCRKWELTGLPYAYSFKINPMNGKDMWESVQLLWFHHCITHVGRPKKNRKRSAYEISQLLQGKLNRKGKYVTCSTCNNKGHNKRACKGQGGSQQGAPGLQTDGASGSRPTAKRTKKSVNPIK
nr:hypothetical protein [Tanacetum cinerariifolium]